MMKEEKKGHSRNLYSHQLVNRKQID